MKIRGDQWVGLWSVWSMVLMSVSYIRNQLDFFQAIAGMLATVLTGYVAYSTVTKATTMYAASKMPNTPE